MPTNAQLAIGLSGYSFPFVCGFLQREGKPAHDSPMDAFGLIDLAAKHNLSSVEFPLSLLPDTKDATIKRLRGKLDKHQLGVVIDTPVIDIDLLRESLPLAKRCGARVVRAMMSGFLEGARAIHIPDWTAHMRDTQQRIAAIYPLLEEHNLLFAIENHQDATAQDLAILCELGGERIGITFDVVNPLAVGETPDEFLSRCAKKIFNVHIKDYAIYPSESGYRLVRAAIGEGVIDWRLMFNKLHETAPIAIWHIELAAQNARHIRLFDEDWWRGYPPKTTRELLPLLKMVAQHARPRGEAWQTLWERSATKSIIARGEMADFERTMRFLKQNTEVRIGQM
jgi:sugar phosphate isomerase/epimerase